MGNVGPPGLSHWDHTDTMGAWTGNTHSQSYEQTGRHHTERTSMAEVADGTREHWERSDVRLGRSDTIDAADDDMQWMSPESDTASEWRHTGHQDLTTKEGVDTVPPRSEAGHPLPPRGDWTSTEVGVSRDGSAQPPDSGPQDVYIGRGSKAHDFPPSVWGNPYKVRQGTREAAVRKHRQWI